MGKRLLLLLDGLLDSSGQVDVLRGLDRSDFDYVAGFGMASVNAMCFAQGEVDKADELWKRGPFGGFWFWKNLSRLKSFLASSSAPEKLGPSLIVNACICSGDKLSGYRMKQGEFSNTSKADAIFRAIVASFSYPGQTGPEWVSEDGRHIHAVSPIYGSCMPSIPWETSRITVVGFGDHVPRGAGIQASILASSRKHEAMEKMAKWSAHPANMMNAIACDSPYLLEVA